MSDRQQDEDALARKQRLADEADSVATEPADDPVDDGFVNDEDAVPLPLGDADKAAAPPAREAEQERPAGAPPAEPSADGAVFIPRITAGAFVEDDAIRKMLSDVQGDRRMMRASLEMTEGDIRTAAAAFREEAPPELVIVESRLSGDELFPALEQLAEQCPPGTRVIVIGHVNDVRLYRQLLKFGIGDYLVSPVEPIALIEAIGQLFQEGVAERLGKVVAFIGARGGAGSSTVALNVASAMGHHCHASALLIDLDVHFGTAALDLNLEPAQGVREALDEGERLDATLLDRLTTAYDDRLGVLAAPCKLGEAPQTDPEAVGQLIDTARAATPHLLLDLPSEWSPAVRKALLAADEIVLTATPDLAALRNARNILGTLKSARQNDAPPRLVLNGFGQPKRKELSVEDYQRVLDLEPAARIPHDPVAFSQASARGEPLAVGSSAAAQPFRQLAWTLTGQKEGKGKPSGLGGWARRLLGGRA